MNSRPPACKAGTLPTELRPHIYCQHSVLYLCARCKTTYNGQQYRLCPVSARNAPQLLLRNYDFSAAVKSQILAHTRKLSNKTALLTGITGQDGSLLAALLLQKGYTVHGVKRRSSLFNTARIDHLYQDPHIENSRLVLHHGDMTDSTSLIQILQKAQPDEIYNLAAQSHVHVSFDAPEYTANSDALGPLRLLEGMRTLDMKESRFIQASTSEMYGQAQETPQTETTPFAPRSPYGAAKLYGYWITVNYREAYGLYAANSITFNHESPVRGETFVTRKITRAVARIKYGLDDCLYIGNLDAKRDWSHAQDCVRGMWLILQQEKPDDFVLASGRVESVRFFLEQSFALAGLNVAWEGSGIEEVGRDTGSGKIIVRVDPRYFRPAEIDLLHGDASKARRVLGWEPQITLDALIEEMVTADMDIVAAIVS